MAREEERLGAAFQFYDKHKSAAANLTLVDSFVYGAKWADKTMVEKVSKCLNKNITNYKSDMMGYIEYSQISDIIQDFRKAMEE